MSEVEILPGVSVDIDDDVVDLGEHGTVKLFERNWGGALDPLVRNDPRMSPMPRPKWTGTKEDYAKGYGAGWAGLVTMPYNALMSFATAGIPGDLRERTRNSLMLPTEEEFGQKMGADTESTAFTAGTLGIPGVDDALLKFGPAAVNSLAGFAGMLAHHGSRASRYDVVPKGTMTKNIRDIFDEKYIGDPTKGEGATAFGWGLYFAENPKVAGQYKEVLSAPVASGFDDIHDSAPSIAAQFLRDSNGDPKKAVNDLLKTVDEIKGDSPQLAEIYTNIADRIKTGKFEYSAGHLYSIEYPDELYEKMLDWDAPLSEQPESVRKALQPLVDSVTSRPFRNNPVQRSQDAVAAGTGTADDFYRMLSSTLGGDEAASKALNQAGIPGIRFYDGSSRAKGEGTRNIVVFNPDDITQVKRDGEVVFKKQATNALADQEFAVTALKHDDTAAGKAAVMAGRETPPVRVMDVSTPEGVDMIVYDKSKIYGEPVYEVNELVVPDAMQGQGVGTNVMQDLTNAADAEGATLILNADSTVSGRKGSKAADKKLIAFYRQHGFVTNTGRNKDFRFGGPTQRNVMYRYPKTE